MPSIVSYQKYIDATVSRTLRLPEAPDTHGTLGTELATLTDGRTYVALPDGAVLPSDQPAEIVASIVNPVALTDAQRAEIKTASPHMRLIDQRVREQIAEQYSVTDELKLLRLGPSADFTTYTAYVDACRAWGAGERARLGL